MAVGKKLDYDDENLIIQAFRVADTSTAGELDMEQFVVAYEALYNGNLAGSGDHEESFVRALRYGIDKSKVPARYVVQLYSGTISEMNKVSDLLEDTCRVYKGTLEDIVALMLKDSRANQRFGSNVLWWIDICVENVLPNIVNTVIQTFGLPTDIEACFYNEYLTNDRESRVCMGPGVISKPIVKALNKGQALETNSFSLFVQSMYIKNVPIVQECGWWVDCLRPQILKNFFQYLYSRLSQFMSYSGSVSLDYCKAVQLAEAASKVCYQF